MVYLLMPLCICAILHVSMCMHLSCNFMNVGMLYLLYSLLLHLFCNYVRLCVDVGTHVATS
jgi:hypothetical protein